MSQSLGQPAVSQSRSQNRLLDLSAPRVTGGVAKSTSWTAMGRFGAQLLQFAAGLVLARLLAPADFGLMATVYVITGFSMLFFDLGLLNALIYQKKLTQSTLQTAFWVNALGGGVFVLLMALAGPLVALFFSDPRLILLTPLAGLPFLLSVGVVQNALLCRQGRFKDLAGVELAAAAAGAAVTLIFAVAGLGVWALVTGPVFASLTNTVLLWRLMPWRPQGFIDKSEARVLWRFSSGVLGNGVVTFLGRNMDNLLLGRYSGATALGYYSRAYNLMNLPTSQLGQVVGVVMMPTLSALENLDDQRAAYLKARRILIALSAPVLLSMAVTAPALVPLLWGGGWESTVVPLQLLCLGAIAVGIEQSDGWLFQARGRTGLLFKVGLVKSIVLVAAIVVGIQWSIDGVAAAVAIALWTAVPISLVCATSLLAMSPVRTLLGDLRVVVCSVGAAAAVWALPQLLGAPRDDLLMLLLQLGAGGLLYCALLFVLARPTALDLLQVVRSVMRRG